MNFARHVCALSCATSLLVAVSCVALFALTGCAVPSAKPEVKAALDESRATATPPPPSITHQVAVEETPHMPSSVGKATPPEESDIAPPGGKQPIPVSEPSDRQSSRTTAAKTTPESGVNQPHKPTATVVSPTIPRPTPSTDALGTAILSGHVELIAGAGQQLVPSDVLDTVLYFVPASRATPPEPKHFQIYMRGKQFDPATLVIPVGSTVSFPNQDEILHNVFSVSPAGSFDLGFYGEGKSAQYTFRRTGLALINCNVHPQMQANVLVLDTPYYVHPNAQGRFTLSGLPNAAGTLMVWHPRAVTQSVQVGTVSAATVPVRVVLTKPRVIQHLNKEQRAY